MRNNNWYIAEDGTVRTKNNSRAAERNADLYIAEDGTVRSRNNNATAVRTERPNITGNGTAVAQNNQRTTGNTNPQGYNVPNVPSPAPAVPARAWDGMNGFAKFTTVILMIVCLISIIFFADTGLFMHMAASSVFFMVSIYVVPVILFIIYMCKLSYISDCAFEWISAAETACFAQMLLCLIEDPTALILGGLIILFAAVMFIGAVSGDGNNAPLVVSMVATPVIIIGLLIYNVSPAEYSLLARLILMAPTVVLACIALYKTFKKRV